MLQEPTLEVFPCLSTRTLFPSGRKPPGGVNSGWPAHTAYVRFLLGNPCHQSPGHTCDLLHSITLPHLAVRTLLRSPRSARYYLLMVVQGRPLTKPAQIKNKIQSTHINIQIIQIRMQKKQKKLKPKNHLIRIMITRMLTRK